ncbi:tetratricopeptide repeat protein [Candidatus Gracilibacteria bacterium]|nr:tetratricopeptide repeat protein [Candidatus Gracilibacteria bacterium]NJM85977.1 tetratricopeptide repeat protein [Hydrococcus sp. RU_2_2]NJP17634.1 tetratricopeptide repeat protein [Hydrococcus sp. CRU_1_1]
MNVKFLLAIASIATINLTNFPVWAIDPEKTLDSSLRLENVIAHYDIDELEGVEKRIRANPNDAEAYLHRAMIRSHSQEDFAGAIEDFNKVIQLDPNRAEAYNYRGTSYFWLKDYQKAMADYDRAIRLAPNLAIAYYNRAYVRLEMGDKQGAIADFRQGATLSQKEGDMMSYDQAQQMIQDLQ